MRPNEQLTALLNQVEQRLDRATTSVTSEETLRDGTRVTRIRGAAVIEVKQAVVREYSRGRASVSEEPAQTIDVDAILGGNRIATADGDAVEAALYASLVADDRYPNISTTTSARRAVACTFAALVGVSTIDEENTVGIAVAKTETVDTKVVADVRG